MRLWRLHPSVEKRLRAAGYDLTRFDWQDEEEASGGGVIVAAARAKHKDEASLGLSSLASVDFVGRQHPTFATVKESCRAKIHVFVDA